MATPLLYADRKGRGDIGDLEAVTPPTCPARSLRIGMRCGRRRTVELRAGGPIDFWRAEAWEDDRLLRFCAEMQVPGRAWLQFEVEPAGGP